MENHEDYIRGMAWTHRNLDKDIINMANFNQKPIPERSHVTDLVGVVFHLPNGNVFTRKNLQYIQQAENEIYTAKFQTNFCFKIMNNCVKRLSIVRYFDGTYSAINPVFNNPDFNNIATVLHTANNTAQTKNSLQRLLGKYAILTPTKARSSITKLILLIGTPLNGYNNVTHKQEEQEEKIKMFVLGYLDIFEKWYTEGLGAMKVYSGNNYLARNYFDTQVMLDLMLAIGSLIFILGFITFQTRSSFIASFGSFSILTSICTTNLIYNLILDYYFLGTFHILAFLSNLVLVLMTFLYFWIHGSSLLETRILV